MTSSVDREVFWMRAEHVAWVEGDDRVVVLSLAAPGSAPLALEATSAAIWMELGVAPRSLSDIAAALARSYGTLVGDIKHDVVDFLRRLQSDGLAIAMAPEEFGQQVPGLQNPGDCA